MVQVQVVLSPHNNSGSRRLKRNDWYAVGQVIAREPYRFDGGLGIQTLAVMDVSQQLFLYGEPLKKIPSAITASDVLGFLKTVFNTHNLPNIGIVISRSVWQSSDEMLADPETYKRWEALKRWDISIPNMAAGDREQIRESLEARGLRVLFDESQLGAE